MLEHLKNNRKFSKLDVTGTETLSTNNEFGIAFEEIDRLHELCINNNDLSEIEMELNAIKDSGTNINHYINAFGCNLMFFVSSREVLNLLLEHGCDPEHRSNGFDRSCVDNTMPACTAMHYAGSYFIWSAVQVLAKAMNDPNVLDDDECSAMGYAQHNYDEFVRDKKNGFSSVPDSVLEKMELMLKKMSEMGLQPVYL